MGPAYNNTTMMMCNGPGMAKKVGERYNIVARRMWVYYGTGQRVDLDAEELRTRFEFNVLFNGWVLREGLLVCFVGARSLMTAFFVVFFFYYQAKV